MSSLSLCATFSDILQWGIVVMPQSLSQVWLHIVFSTKDRQTYLEDRAFREEMFRMLSHHVAEAGCYPKRSNGWIDHVHVVCGLARTVTIAGLIEHLKTETSKWAKKSSNGASAFTWQRGYGAFSVSQSKLESVLEYLERQEEHHKRKSYQDEFRELCRNHGVEIDERYVWD
jgi:putative transposase